VRAEPADDRAAVTHHHAATHGEHHPGEHHPGAHHPGAHHAARHAEAHPGHGAEASHGHAHPSPHRGPTPHHPPQHLPEHHPVQHHPAPHRAPPTRAAAPAVVPVPVPAAPAAAPEPEKGSNTGLPLPRFAALRADEVNMRSGPGTRYPIQWVYKRRDLPVEVEREFDVWRLVEDMDGTKGWVHQATLVGTRTVVVTGPGMDGPDAQAGTQPAPASAGSAHATASVSFAASADAAAQGGAKPLRASPGDDAALVAMLRPGVIARIRACPAGSDWCRVSVRDYSGWVRRRDVWGLLPGETVAPP